MWCDVGCGGTRATFLVQGNTIDYNRGSGPLGEVSTAQATISDNTIQYNNQVDRSRPAGSRSPGARMRSSPETSLGGNTGVADLIVGTRRPLANDSAVSNALNGDRYVGCGVVATVTCS